MPFPALWNGSPIFGLAVTVTPSSEPPRAQKVAYPGVKGTQITTLGSTGFRLYVKGLLADVDEPDLAADELVIFALEQGQIPGVFTDTTNNSYPNCLIENFKPVDPIQPYFDTVIHDGVMREYTLEIFCPNGL